MRDGMFTERTLLADIVDKWGCYGAHADVFRSMLAEIERLRAEVEQLRAELDGEETDNGDPAVVARINAALAEDDE